MGSKEKRCDSKNEICRDVSFFRLFRFAKWWEWGLILLAIVFATGYAACLPLILIAYGEFTTLLVERTMTRGIVTSTPLLQVVGGGQVV